MRGGIEPSERTEFEQLAIGPENAKIAKNQGKHRGLRVHVGSEGDRKRLSMCPEQHAIWPSSVVHDPSLQ
jgi:hypothetical protein